MQMVNWKLKKLEKTWLMLPLLWCQIMISITEGSLWKLFCLVSQFPKVGLPSCLLKRTRSFQVKEVWYLPCKGLYPSAWRGEIAARPREGTETPAGRQSKYLVSFSAEGKCFILLICFVSTLFVAFVLLGWEMAICDLEHICVPKWSQSMLAWREMCYCFLLWRCCCWLKGACCALLLKLQESSIDRPTALGGG